MDTTFLYTYLILASIFLIVNYLFYKVLLSKETFFKINRVYLLSTLLLSIFLPLLWVVENTWLSTNTSDEITVFITEDLNTIAAQFEGTRILNTASKWSLSNILLVIYTLGCSISFILFAKSIITLIRLAVKYKTTKKQGYWQVDLPKSYPTFSFLKVLYLSNNQLNDNDLNTIVLHEEAHMKQWHSLDIILFEMGCIFFWFNPISYAFKKEIQKIHEYLADEFVLKNGVDKERYATLLIENILQANHIKIVNSFFKTNILKSRIMMMNRSESRFTAKLKLAFFAPLFVLLIFIGACTDQLSSEQAEIKLFGYTFSDKPFQKFDLILEENAETKDLPLLIKSAIAEGKLKAYTIDYESEKPLSNELSIEEVEENFYDYWGTVEKDGEKYTTMLTADYPGAKKEKHAEIENTFRLDELNGESYLTMSVAGMFRPTGTDKHIASFRLKDLEKALGAKLKFTTEPYPFAQ